MQSTITFLCHRELEYKLQERKMVLFTELTDKTYQKECYLDDQLHYSETLHSELDKLEQDVHKVCFTRGLFID